MNSSGEADAGSSQSQDESLRPWEASEEEDSVAEEFRNPWLSSYISQPANPIPELDDELYTYLLSRNVPALRKLSKNNGLRVTGSKRSLVCRCILKHLSGTEMFLTSDEFQSWRSSARRTHAFIYKCPDRESLQTHDPLAPQPSMEILEEQISDSPQPAFNLNEFARLAVIIYQNEPFGF